MFNNGKINGYDYEIDEKRTIWFKADQMAEKLGLVQFKKKVKYVRWDTINKFIKDIFPTSWENNVIIDCGNKGTTTIPLSYKERCSLYERYGNRDYLV